MNDDRIKTRMYQAADDKSVIPIAGRERGSRMDLIRAAIQEE